MVERLPLYDFFNMRCFFFLSFLFSISAVCQRLIDADARWRPWNSDSDPFTSSQLMPLPSCHSSEDVMCKNTLREKRQEMGA